MTISSPLGRVLRDDLGIRLEFDRTFDTTVDDLWAALTESERLGRWFGTWTGDQTTGQVELVMTAEDTDEAQTVQIVECVEPTRLIVEFPNPDGSWRLAVELSTVGPGPGPGAGHGGARMVFTHRLAEPYDASSIGPGWHYYLDRLDAAVAGVPVPEDFDPYMSELGTSYPMPV